MCSNVFKGIGFVTVLLILSSVISCSENKVGEIKSKSVEGKAFGTVYEIEYIDSAGRDIKLQVDSIISVIDNSLNAENSNSLVSQFNQSDSCIEIDNHFLDAFLVSSEVHDITDGAFDPTLKPILDLWGFNGYGQIKEGSIENSYSIQKLDSLSENMIDNLGWDLISLKGDVLSKDFTVQKDKRSNFICKDQRNVELTFQALIIGYSADVLSEFLQFNLGINNFKINFGGKILAQGKLNSKEKWQVKFDLEKYTNGKSLELFDKFKNFELSKHRAVSFCDNLVYREVEGKRYSPFVDPTTGKIAERQIVCSIVFANDCVIADAYANSFIIMGIDNAVPLIESNPYEGVEAFFIYQNNEGEYETYLSSGLEDLTSGQ